MTIVHETITVANAAKGSNLANGKFWETSNFNRQITAIALTGSAAADDTQLSIFYGTTKIGEIRNSSTGLAVDVDKDLVPHNSQLFCPRGAKMSIVVDTAPVTNPIKLLLVIAELP